MRVFRLKVERGRVEELIAPSCGRLVTRRNPLVIRWRDVAAGRLLDNIPASRGARGVL